MRIAIGADHAGYELKEALRAELEALGDEVADFGTHSTESCDYPDIAIPLARAVAAGEHDLGVLICSNGVGPSVAANKVPGVRAALCQDAETARGARLWNDANILCLSLRTTTEIIAREILQAWLSTEAPDPSEAENIAKVRALDREPTAS